MSGSDDVPQADLPREHVIRPRLPWRRGVDLTECGLVVESGRPTITRLEFAAKLKSQGSQRAAFTTCMTCWSTAGRWKDWDSDPIEAMSREFYSRRDERLRDELTALALLVEAHREEFDDLLAGLGQALRLDELRRQRRVQPRVSRGGRGA